ncbi:helix-turn-helix transcriptional regulator [Morganella morganii]
MGKSLRQLLAEEKPEVAAAARVQADEILLNIHLAELREKVKKTQVEMAQALGIKQPTVAGMEKPGRDIKLSTLRRYVDAIVPDGTHYMFRV